MITLAKLLCVFSAINVGKVKSDDELEDLCDLAVRSLDELIDYQDYPVEACSKIATKARRSLGIGFIGLAHYLAKLGYKYDSQEAWNAVHGLDESFQYYLLKASNQLAKEKGHCEYFGRTKYADGILPIDTYKKDVDEITTEELAHDWELLEHLSMNLVYGTQHCPHKCLQRAVPLCQTPQTESNHLAITCPLRNQRKDRLQVVPGYTYLKNNYTLLWDMPDNTGYINVVAVMQKFFDQAISGNWSYNPENYENNEVPVSVMAQDFLTTYKYGWKTSYYQNTHDMKSDEVIDVSEKSNTELENLLDTLEKSRGGRV